MTPLTKKQHPSINKTMALPIKPVPRHLYPSLKACIQTPRHMHTHVLIHTGIPRYSLSLYQVSTLYPLPVQSNPHSCQFHFLPTRWPKMHPWKLLHWLPQVHPLAYMPLKHCLKTLIMNQNIRTLKFISLDSAGIDLCTAPCVLVGSVPSLSIAMA